MAIIVRREIRTRGFFGWVFLVIFLGFNALMVLWLFIFWSRIGGVLSSGSEAGRAGAAIGATIATGMIFFLWAAGAVITGLLALLTRGRKSYIEETVAHRDGGSKPATAAKELVPVGQVDAICPSCGVELQKKPSRKTKCPHCGEFIYARTRPSDKKKVLVTERETEEIEEQWSIVNGTHDLYLKEKRRFVDAKDALRRKFGREPSDRDVKWGLLNEDLLSNARERNWGFYRNTRFSMAEMLRQEERYDQALTTYLEICVLDLNGPNNCGGFQDSGLDEGEFPEWGPDPTIAMLAPGILNRVDQVVTQLGSGKIDLAKRLESSAVKLQKSLRLPLTPEEVLRRFADRLNQYLA